jgi:hypothetical protein
MEGRRASNRILFRWEALEPRFLLSTFDIAGVQPAALDQPQIHALFRRSANGTPLQASNGLGGTSFDVQAFLDTGTSGMLLSQETAQGLGINSSTFGGQTVTYSDVGVGGTEDFDVSEPIYTALAPFIPTADVDNINTYNSVYNQKYGPVRVQISRTPADPLVGPLDILGMPLLNGKVMVMDPKPVENLDNIHTFVYNPGAPYNASARETDPGIPIVNRHVKLSYSNFSRFAQVTPAGAGGPNLASNPFIGPDPTRALQSNPPPDNTPPVSLAEGTHTATGSFLFDTGAAASFMSRAVANNLGVHYKPGTYNSQDPNVNPDLVDANGKDLPNQFIIPLGGVGGTLNVAGFFVDSMTLPTVEGQGIRFTHAPVLVADISVMDPVTKQSLTLDGDFGMNYLVASADISGGFPSNVTAGAFDWVTFDQPNALLGLQINGAPVLPPVVSSAGFNDEHLPQKLTFTFSSNVSGVSASSLQIQNAATHAVLTPSSLVYDAATKTATATFTTSVPDGAYTATLLASAITDSSGNHLDGTASGVGGTNYVFSFSHLLGDANHDGVVDITDLAIVQNNAGSGTTWSQGDFNYDGIVDITDLGIVQNNAGRTISFASAVAPAAAATPSLSVSVVSQASAGTTPIATATSSIKAAKTSAAVKLKHLSSTSTSEWTELHSHSTGSRPVTIKKHAVLSKSQNYFAARLDFAAIDGLGTNGHIFSMGNRVTTDGMTASEKWNRWWFTAGKSSSLA